MDNDKNQMKSEVSYIPQIYAILIPSVYCDVTYEQKKILRVRLYLREMDMDQFSTSINYLS